MADPRLELALELRAAGLVERADALIAEVLRETGIRPVGEVQVELDATLAGLRSALGMRQKRRRAVNPRPTVQDRVTGLLAAVGVSDLYAWKVSRGYWLRNQADVMRWECLARRWGDRVARGEGFHVGSWSSMSDCVKYGISAVDGEKHDGGYCTISVEARYPVRPKAARRQAGQAKFTHDSAHLVTLDSAHGRAYIRDMQRTTVDDITSRQIKTLKREADEHGDLRMVMVCDLATDGPDALDGAEPGTEADILCAEGRSQEWARAECARVISEAQAKSDE